MGRAGTVAAMATSTETVWVADRAQLQATVQTLVDQGGQVRHDGPGEVHLHVPRKLNVAVLVGGLVLCIVPGLAYLIWYTAADRSRMVVVKVGSPPQLRAHPPSPTDSPAAPTPPPDVEPTVFGPPRGAPEPPPYPAGPATYPAVEQPPPPPPPPG
jgi:hypothetical protein